MWFPDCFFYHIYPLGFCGAPEVNDGSSSHRLQKITEWIPHMRRLGVNALYLGPLFESDSHGYDTRDYGSVDRRLGTNEELRALCRELHAAGIKVVFDGVFNHVGRGFWAFQDVKQKRWDSPYKDWFHIRFEHNNAYNDGFSYDNWEGHDQLVRLNLHNPAVVDHLFAQIRMWHDTFGLDGLRLDVAYLLPDSFLRSLRSFCRELDPEFVLIGEMIHGDYNRLVRPDMLDSSTNYECFKGIHSAFNDRNLFEIGHSLARQFGPEPWTLYKDKILYNYIVSDDFLSNMNNFYLSGSIQSHVALRKNGLDNLYSYLKNVQNSMQAKLENEKLLNFDELVSLANISQNYNKADKKKYLKKAFKTINDKSELKFDFDFVAGGSSRWKYVPKITFHNSFITQADLAKYQETQKRVILSQCLIHEFRSMFQQLQPSKFHHAKRIDNFLSWLVSDAHQKEKQLAYDNAYLKTYGSLNRYHEEGRRTFFFFEGRRLYMKSFIIPMNLLIKGQGFITII